MKLKLDLNWRSWSFGKLMALLVLAGVALSVLFGNSIFVFGALGVAIYVEMRRRFQPRWPRWLP